jgi:hypothetical protein
LRNESVESHPSVDPSFGIFADFAAARTDAPVANAAKKISTWTLQSSGVIRPL